MNNKKIKYEEELEKYRKVVIDCLNHTQDSEKYVYLMKKESNLQNKLIKLGISSGKLNSIYHLIFLIGKKNVKKIMENC